MNERQNSTRRKLPPIWAFSPIRLRSGAASIKGRAMPNSADVFCMTSGTLRPSLPLAPLRRWKATIPDAGGAGMSSDLFQTVRDGLQPRLADVLADILPGGRIVGREYCCASLEGGQGNSCRTNLQNGVGSDFATGERWSDIISLAAQCWRLRPGEAARELARRYALSSGLRNNIFPLRRRVPLCPCCLCLPSAPEPPRRHGQLGTYTQLWRYLDEAGRLLACVARFSREDGSKVILPLSYGREGGTGSPGWF